MTTQALARQVSDQSDARVQRAADATLGPGVPVEEAEPGQLDLLAAVAAAAIATQNVRAAALGDLAVASALTLSLGVVVPSRGLGRPAGEVERLRAAVRVTLDRAASLQVGQDVADPAEARPARVLAQRATLTRIARAEPQEALHAAMFEALLGQVDAGVPTLGWVRQTDGDVCPQCEHWSDGLWRPASVRMKRHTGDECIAVPVTTREVEARGLRGAGDRRERAFTARDRRAGAA